MSNQVDDSKASCGFSPQEAIVKACRILEAANQADLVWGHVSVRDHAGRGVWLKGSNLGFDEVRADDVILLSWDGEILEGAAGRHVEYPIHLEIMRTRDDVGAVVHTHPIYSVAFAATGWPLMALSHEGRCFVPPDIARFEVTGNMIRTAELGRALSECLGDRNAALLPHHGIVTVGSNIGIAVAAAMQLERACQIALLAGEHAIPSSDEEAMEKRPYNLSRLPVAWEYLERTQAR